MNVQQSIAHRGEDGQVRLHTWTVGEEALASVIKDRSMDFVRQSMLELAQAFPMFFAHASKDSWHNPILGPSGHPYVFSDDGIVDPVTGDQYDGPLKEVRLAFRGKLPLPIEGRPFLDSITLKIQRKKKLDEKRKWNQCFLQSDKGLLLTIPIYAGYDSDDPLHAQPQVGVPQFVWTMFGIPIDHMLGRRKMGEESLATLCQYQYAKTGMTVTEALQQRTVPRMVIDLTLADIQAMGRWDDFKTWMSRNRLSLHSLYNVVGKDSKSSKKKNQALLEFYKECVEEYDGPA